MALPGKRMRQAEPTPMLYSRCGGRDLPTIASKPEGRENNGWWKNNGTLADEQHQVFGEGLDVDVEVHKAEDDTEPSLEQVLVSGNGDFPKPRESTCAGSAGQSQIGSGI